MKEISSKDNKIYKLCKQLQIKKYRDKFGKYLVEGPNLIEEAFKSNADIEAILVRNDYNAYDWGVWPEEKIYQLSQQLFSGLAETKTSQGILAIVKKNEVPKADFFKGANGRNYVVLDKLQDQGNIGTILRTAAAANYKGVIVIKGSGDVYSSKTIRAAAGAVFRLPILFVDTPMQAVGLLKEQDKTICVTCLEDAHMYSEVNLKNDIALVIGNEGNGVCEDFLNLADIKIKLPMDNEIESLNAAVAAGILMYEAKRQ